MFLPLNYEISKLNQQKRHLHIHVIIYKNEGLSLGIWSPLLLVVKTVLSAYDYALVRGWNYSISQPGQSEMDGSIMRTNHNES